MTPTNNDTPELLPCPFCGGKPYVFWENSFDEHREIGCQECNYFFICDLKDLNKAWNNRTPAIADGVEIMALREIREIYCNMEGFIPETAPEAYVLQEIERMYKVAVDALAGTRADGVGVDHSDMEKIGKWLDDGEPKSNVPAGAIKSLWQSVRKINTSTPPQVATDEGV